MTAFFDFFIDMWSSLFSLLSSVSFDFYGYSVNLLSILFVLFVVGFIITAFWKGSKT